MVSLSSDIINHFPNFFITLSSNLPKEIISDIFTRLPVKSLCQFKCVSKSIYSMLHHPNFINEHLQRSIQKDPSLILRTDFRVYVVNNENEERISRARRVEMPFATSLCKVEISGSCNGILCISDQTQNQDIFIYNPSTGVHMRLPTPEFDIPTTESTCFSSLGFGSHQNDYKVVKCVYLYDKPFMNIDSYICEARIYSFSTNNWRKIGDIPFHISSRVAVTFGDKFLVWKASKGFGLGMSVLVVAFDMETDKFWEVQRPELAYKPRECQIELGIYQGQFSIYHMWSNDRVEIWTQKEFGLVQSWRKLFVIGPNLVFDEPFLYLKPLLLMRDGKILIEKGEGELILYDPGSETAIDFKIPGAPRWFRVTSYVSSLVSPFKTRALT